MLPLLRDMLVDHPPVLLLRLRMGLWTLRWALTRVVPFGRLLVIAAYLVFVPVMVESASRRLARWHRVLTRVGGLHGMWECLHVWRRSSWTSRSVGWSAR